MEGWEALELKGGSRMIILITEDYSKRVLKSVLELIKELRPNWKYTTDKDTTKADVYIWELEGDDLGDDVEELSEDTQGLVIGISEGSCISETSVGFSAGLTDVREHIRDHVGRYW